MSGAVHVTPGKAYLVVHQGTGVALAPNPPGDLAARVSDTVLGGQDADAVLEALIADGLRSVTDFVVFAIAESTTRLVVRGSAVTVRVEGPDRGAGEDILSAGLWTDRTVPSALGVVIGSGRTVAQARRFRLQSGEAAFSQVVVREQPAESRALESPAEPLSESDPATSLVPAPQAARPVAAAPDSAPSTPPPFKAVGAGAADEGYDRLFGATGRLAPPGPADAPDADEEAVDPAPRPIPVHRSPIVGARASSASAGDPAHTLTEAPEPFAASAAAGAVITGVPWLTGAPAAPEPAMPSPPVLSTSVPTPTITSADTHDGGVVLPDEPSWSGHSSPSRSALSGDDVDLTVNRATLARHLPSSLAPLVSAARCPNGHLTQSHGVTCRVCRAPVSSQSAVEVPRPVLGRLCFDNGDEFPLDRGYLFGRNPSLPDGYVGEQPNVVKLADAGRDISSQHLEVKVVGWNVYVIDLGSTNGTEVVLPGQPPKRLRERDEVLIEAGTVVTLAEVRRFTFEVA